MKLAASLLALVPALAGAWEHPWLRDWKQPVEPIRPIIVVPTLPNTNFRDYTQPGFRLEPNGYIYQTVPGTNYRNYSKPSYRVEEIW